MKRRDFLRYGIGISLASSSFYSLANMMNHAQHGNMAMMQLKFASQTIKKRNFGLITDNYQGHKLKYLKAMP